MTHRRWLWLVVGMLLGRPMELVRMDLEYLHSWTPRTHGRVPVAQVKGKTLSRLGSKAHGQQNQLNGTMSTSRFWWMKSGRSIRVPVVIGSGAQRTVEVHMLMSCG